MRLQILLILLIQVVLVESNEVIGYVEDSITLSSGGISGNLSIIKWSVFSNSTWIATYQSEKINTDRFSQYKGRLSLNISTGDLTINNLTEKDSMEYTVDLINTEKQSRVSKTQLKVIKRLQRPTIKTLFSTSEKEGCWIGLHCIADGDLSWQVNSTDVTTNRMNNTRDQQEFISAFHYNKQTTVQITCISKRKEETTSHSVTTKCDDVKPQIQHQHQCRERCGLCVLLGIVLGVAIAGITYACKDEIKKAKDSLSEKLCS